MNRLVLLCFSVVLAACSSTPEGGRSLLTYRIDVRQGNLVTQEMASQLKPGLTKDQVRFILGTPLVADVFHADRWDYIYRFRPGRDYSEAEQRHLVVFFEKGKLARVGGDVLANKPDVPAKPATRVIDIAPASDSAN
jgi:outer membrane protein assembly factor BamE